MSDNFRKENRNKEFKKIERYLRNYKNYKTGLITLKKQLDFIMPSMTASYEIVEGSTGTFNIKNETEQFAIERIEGKRALVIHEDIQRYKIIIESIDEALKELDDIEKTFVQLRYFERRTIQQTSIELGYSEKYVFNLRNQVLDKLLISLKGLIQF